MKHIAQALVGVSGLALIGLAVWITKDPRCLWAIILVAWITEAMGRMDP